MTEKKSQHAPKARSVKTRSPKARYWSARVTEQSDALDLEPGVFTKNPRAMAESLKRSAERSKRRKSSPFRSALSMLSFYENRAGKNLPAARKRVIAAAKDELRRLYGRAVPSRRPSPRRSGRAA